MRPHPIAFGQWGGFLCLEPDGFFTRPYGQRRQLCAGVADAEVSR
jgi:hypothetical protein